MEHFSETCKVRWYELGRDNRLKIPSFLNYLEHAAGVHAEHLGLSVSSLGEMGITWVLARMKLEFHRLPELGEDVTVRTWPAGAERLLFRRDYLVTDGNDDVLLRGASYWVVFGLESRRIVPVPDEWYARFPKVDDLALTQAEIRLPSLSEAEPGPAFHARLSDIDQNGHVNNGRFVDFVLEDAFCRGKDEQSLKGLEIAYRSEALRSDEIQAFGVEEPEKNALLHKLVRQSDGAELVRARTYWPDEL